VRVVRPGNTLAGLADVDPPVQTVPRAGKAGQLHAPGEEFGGIPGCPVRPAFYDRSRSACSMVRIT
jgi:hypothetical protein